MTKKIAISACIPIWYGEVGTPLLLSKEWCEAHGLKGVCALDRTCTAKKTSNKVMTELFETWEALQKRRMG